MLRGYPYPSVGFRLWHVAPQSVSTTTYAGGMLSFVIVGVVFGLCWGWVAYRTGSIRWTVISHVAGLGALVYFR